MTYGRFEVDLTVLGCIGHAILWALLTLVTLGIAAFFYPYALAKFVINRTYVVEGGRRTARLYTDLGVFSEFVHALLWLLLSLVTFGVAYFVYLYRVGVFVMRQTELQPL
jgi:hypothetical protein